LNDIDLFDKIFEDFKPDVLVNLAAQADVRFSIKKPKDYIQSNILGFSNILQRCVDFGVKTLFMHQVVQFMEGMRNSLLMRMILLAIL
tara:strand:- start:663 stop:926 length:264 start_codon:yes stop_codon:yes gene_type:complete